MSGPAPSTPAPRLAPPGRAALAGAKLAWGRLRRPALLVAALLALLLAGTTGILEHAAATHGAADRALGVVFRWIVPLLGFGLASSALGPEPPGASVWGLARYGLSRRWLVLGLCLGTMAVAALLTLGCVELALVAAYGGGTGLGHDAWTSAGIAALGASSYVAWTFAGATLGRRGRGRYLPLLCDFVLGFGVGTFALPWPRAHLRNLLGDLAVGALSPAASSVVLLSSTVALVLAVMLASRE
jgi:hypothetical protein